MLFIKTHSGIFIIIACFLSTFSMVRLLASLENLKLFAPTVTVFVLVSTFITELPCPEK